MSQYGPGTTLTCDTTNGNAIISFSSSVLLLSNVTLTAWFTLNDDSSPVIEISSLDSNTQLTLVTNWTGSTSTGQYFVINQDFTTSKEYPIFHQGDRRVGKILGKFVNMLDDDMVRLELDDGLTLNNTSSGIWFPATINQTAIFGSALYYDATGYSLANASSSSTMPCVALAIEAGSGNKKIFKQGFIRNNSWSWTPGGLLYMSTTNGTLTQTKPTGVGNQQQVVGYAYTSNIIHFNPNYNITVAS